MTLPAQKGRGGMKAAGVRRLSFLSVLAAGAAERRPPGIPRLRAGRSSGVETIGSGDSSRVLTKKRRREKGSGGNSIPFRDLRSRTDGLDRELRSGGGAPAMPFAMLRGAKLRLAALFAVLVLCTPAASRATSVIPITDADLQARADVVVHGIVTSSEV